MHCQIEHNSCMDERRTRSSPYHLQHRDLLGRRPEATHHRDDGDHVSIGRWLRFF